MTAKKNPKKEDVLFVEWIQQQTVPMEIRLATRPATVIAAEKLLGSSPTISCPLVQLPKIKPFLKRHQIVVELSQYRSIPT
jgi:hypothetical protein